mgnify:CR=1 FL=1
MGSAWSPSVCVAQAQIHDPNVVGWPASALLIATLARQVHAQSRNPDASGVSRWIFIGQSAASIGFIVYAWLLDNLVFIVTNSLILLNALVGQCTVAMRKRKQGQGGAG